MPKPKKTSFKQTQTTEQKSLSPSEQIEAILKLYKSNPKRARLAVEMQARKIWLQYLFQQHQEITITEEVEEVEERQQIFGGGNPDGEIITNRRTKKTTTKTTIPKTPVWAIRAALTFDWSVGKKFQELEALSLCVEAGLVSDSALDSVVKYTTGFADLALESQLVHSEEITSDVSI